MAAPSIDQQFIEYIIKSIVGKPDDVKVKRTIDEKGVLLELEVDPEDLGRVIGKRGATAQSLRTLLRALGTKNDARYNLKIVDTGPPPEKKSQDAPTNDAPAVKPTDDDSTAADDQTVSDELEAEKADEGTPSEEADMSGPKDDIVTEEPAVTDHSSVIDKTRKELADLDDLDI